MSFSDYLRQQGVPKNASPETIERHKTAYQKLQQKAKRDRHREKFTRLELSLNASEDELITEQAKQHGLPKSVYFKRSAFAYLEQLFIVPNEARIQRLETEIPIIGNNINQLVRHCHTKKSVEMADLRAIRQDLNRLERLLSEELRNPPNLNYLVEQACIQHPNYKPILLRKLQQLP